MIALRTQRELQKPQKTHSPNARRNIVQHHSPPVLPSPVQIPRRKRLQNIKKPKQHKARNPTRQSPRPFHGFSDRAGNRAGKKKSRRKNKNPRHRRKLVDHNVRMIGSPRALAVALRARHAERKCRQRQQSAANLASPHKLQQGATENRRGRSPSA